MTGRFLLVTTDAAIVTAVKSALDTTASLLQIDQVPEDGSSIGSTFQPNGVIIDSDARVGVQSVFERIAGIRREFPEIPVIALGNEASAQLVLAALRAGATDFLDRAANQEQMQQALQNCLTRNTEVKRQNCARIAGVLSALPSEQDQDFALNLAVRAAFLSPSQTVLYIDLSLPATQTGVALGMQLEFSVSDAIRELARLDRSLLEGALARDARSGLYVMPLSADFHAEAVMLDAAGFAALLQILKGIFQIIIIGYGPFSHQRALLDMVRPGAKFFLCCNQRFPSIRGAAELLHWIADNRISDAPHVVVHQMAPGLTPTPADIRRVLNISASIDIDGRWDELADHLNDGKPIALTASRYKTGIDACLAHLGLAVEPKRDLKSMLRGWLNLDGEAAAS